MHRKSQLLRAEELLAEENFSEELLSPNGKDGLADENEIRIARDIYSFLNASSEGLSGLEKEQTKNQIRFSVRKLTIKRETCKLVGSCHKYYLLQS